VSREKLDILRGMLQKLTKLAIVLLVSAMISLPTASQAVAGDVDVILMANFQATLRAGAQLRQMKGQAKVRNGSKFPIEFDDFRILVSLTQVSAAEYAADLVIEELSNREWVPINADAVFFRSSYSAPTEFEWAYNDYFLELAIAISVISE
jgi:hypothetical protein